MSESFKVNILGTEYSLRTNDEELVRELAAELDTELKDLQQKLPGKPPTTLAVLTALNISEQHAHSQMNELREVERLADEIETLCEILESK